MARGACNTTVMPTSADLHTGIPVRAINGQSLGTLRAVVHDHFSLELDGRELWLPLSSIFTVSSEAVTLIYERNGVLRNGCPGKG